MLQCLPGSKQLVLYNPYMRFHRQTYIRCNYYNGQVAVIHLMENVSIANITNVGVMYLLVYICSTQDTQLQGTGHVVHVLFKMVTRTDMCVVSVLSGSL